ncbi:MAG TPA: DUF2934 domain-containing protein [Acidisarcina sp.]
MSASTPIKSAAKPRARKSASKKATPPTKEQIASLAEKYWTESGRPHGSAEHDWLRAERELMGKAS